MKKQANILFINSSSSGKGFGLRSAHSRDDYYQQLIGSLLTRSINTKEGFETLGRQLAALASHAYLSRQIEAVKLTSQLMLALPISSQLKAVGRYYQAICIKKKGDFEGARQILEGVMDEATPQYRARALLSIGATYFDSGEVESSLPFYLSAGSAACEHDPVSFVESQRQIAIIRSLHGDHKQALNNLERLFPLVRVLGKHYPSLYYDFINSLAVEFCELGSIAEAEAACAITLASPFVATHLHWIETRDEIAEKRQSATHSVVAVGLVSQRKTSSQSQPERYGKRRHAFKLNWLARHSSSFQISVAAIATKAIARFDLIHCSLRRVRNNARPRAPPANS